MRSLSCKNFAQGLATLDDLHQQHTQNGAADELADTYGDAVGDAGQPDGSAGGGVREHDGNFNAVIIGIEIAVMFPDPSSSAPIWLACITNGISVGIGELISCTILGVLLVKIIESSKALNKIFAEA